MKRKNSATVWQMRLFEGFDADVMVLQRDEQEVFDDAIHVFFDREYYDSYVGRAKKYSDHDYAYHEDKLGEVIYQVFDENIPGIVLHMNPVGESKGVLCREKYMDIDELRILEEVAKAYHDLYMTSLERKAKEETIANLWMKNVFIIGQFGPETQFMTLKRKNDGTPIGEDGQYDYECIKVFLTYDSAVKYNPENKPINSYKLGTISSVARGRVRVIIEPHRNYWLEFDPATLNLNGYYQAPQWDDEKVLNRIKEVVAKDELYMLLSPANSDYVQASGTPFIAKDNGETSIYIYENYEDAVTFCNRYPAALAAYGGIYPIGVLKKDSKFANLNTVLAVCKGLGVFSLFLDNEMPLGLCLKLPYFMEKAELSTELETFMAEEDWSQIKRVDEDGQTRYNIPLVPFVDESNEFIVTDERKQKISEIIETDDIVIRSFLATASLTECIFALGEVARRYDAARKAGDTIVMSKYGSLLNLVTAPIAELIYERPYIFTLRNEDGSFVRKNDLPYLIVTNRYETGRKGEGVPTPVRIENEDFMKEFESKDKIAILTDGPNAFCIVDTHLLFEKVKEVHREDSVHEEILIYMTQGLGIAYDEASQRLRRLKADTALYNEFVSNVRNTAYSSYGSIEVAGWTAVDLSNKKGMNMLEAYETLLDMEIESVINQKDVGPDELLGDGSDEDLDDRTEKKGFFGKLFKK